eukprot:TRINITY_DN742_c2_g1_i1.p1 TRINITY_DN742_c2_g1~~TRINITY_DN742_c2_g1_i1.p1  ORF type:complete len:497 (+),score=103.95 TRINITY_DN742_c2_g1_i1:132-1622(+)
MVSHIILKAVHVVVLSPVVMTTCLIGRWGLSLAPLALLVGGDNCGVVIPRVPGAPDNRFQVLSKGNADVTDLDDQLFSVPSLKEYKRLQQRCAEGEGPDCFTYGIEPHEWNLWHYALLEHEGAAWRKKRPSEEDLRILPKAVCGRDVVCKDIDGAIRIVGTQGHLTRRSLLAWSQLPHLYGLSIDDISDEDFSDLKLPSSLRMVSVHIQEPVTRFAALAALLRAQGKVVSVHVYGQQDRKNWLPLDLSLLCGLDLVRFTSYVVHIVGGAIPACWSQMRSLKHFYCTNCMMTAPPTALQGMTNLKTFVAFRQSEMIPCALNDLAEYVRKCKPSWETRHGFKEGGLRASSGQWQDFQEGPSFSCPEHSYAFQFSDIVNLGWTGIRKVWLDGNFLTGTIPEDLADKWPELQSLDLYSNAMDGRVPDGLSRLQMVKLQLQENNFSGNFPVALFDHFQKRRHITLGISDNAQLSGCFTSRGGWGLGGTKITSCDDRTHEEL